MRVRMTGRGSTLVRRRLGHRLLDLPERNYLFLGDGKEVSGENGPSGDVYRAVEPKARVLLMDTWACYQFIVTGLTMQTALITRSSRS